MKYLFLVLIYFFLISCHEKVVKDDTLNVNIDSIYVSKITANYHGPIYKSDVKLFFKTNLCIKDESYKTGLEDNYYFSKILNKEGDDYIYEFKFIIPSIVSKSLSLRDIKKNYYWIFKSQILRVEHNGNYRNLNVHKSDDTIVKYFIDKMQILESDSINMEKIESFVPKVIIYKK